jgi:hypothetical protein
MLHGYTANPQQGFVRGDGSGNGNQDDNRGENHEVGIEQKEHAGVVEAPTALQAAGRLSHTPGGNEKREKLPMRAVQISNVGKSGKPETGGKCAQRQENGAQ